MLAVSLGGRDNDDIGEWDAGAGSEIGRIRDRPVRSIRDDLARVYGSNGSTAGWRKYYFCGAKADAGTVYLWDNRA